MSENQRSENPSLRDQLAVESYRKLWEHLWHVDRQRLAFTSFYAIIIAGSLAVFFSEIGTQGFAREVILSFVFVLSLFGWLFNYRANQHVEKQVNTIWEIAGKKEIEEFVALGEKEIGLWGYLKLRSLYLTLFFCGGLVSLGALIYILAS